MILFSFFDLNFTLLFMSIQEKKESALEKAERYIRDQSSPLLKVAALLESSKTVKSASKQKELYNLYCPMCHEMANKKTDFYSNDDALAQISIDCGHCYQQMHSDCLNRWKKHHGNTCPACNENFN